MKNALKARLRSKNGTTMVELVVTFALLALFMGMIVFVLTSSLSLYRTISGHANAQAVSKTLMEKVCGELSGAQPGVAQTYDIAIDMDADTNTPRVDFYNRTGSHIYITARKDYLLIHYYAVDDNNRHLDAVDWTFDSAVYHGFTIESLQFTRMKEENGHTTNIIHVELTLQNEQTGYEYSAERYVQCFNFPQ